MSGGGKQTTPHCRASPPQFSAVVVSCACACVYGESKHPPASCQSRAFWCRSHSFPLPGEGRKLKRLPDGNGSGSGSGRASGEGMIPEHSKSRDGDGRNGKRTIGNGSLANPALLLCAETDPNESKRIQRETGRDGPRNETQASPFCIISPPAHCLAVPLLLPLSCLSRPGLLLSAIVAAVDTQPCATSNKPAGRAATGAGAISGSSATRNTGWARRAA